MLRRATEARHGIVGGCLRGRLCAGPRVASWTSPGRGHDTPRNIRSGSRPHRAPRPELFKVILLGSRTGPPHGQSGHGLLERQALATNSNLGPYHLSPSEGFLVDPLNRATSPPHGQGPAMLCDTPGVVVYVDLDS